VKLRPAFDIHDRDVTPVVYHLMFALTHFDMKGNDVWYEITPDQLADILGDEDGWSKDTEDFFVARLPRKNTCYFDPKQVDELLKRPKLPTLKEAILEYNEWLKERGVDPDDEAGVLVKVWW
jgi:hypothetical protein